MQDINFGQKSPNTADILCPISYKKFEFLSSAEVWRGKTHATLELPTNAADEVKKSLILNHFPFTLTFTFTSRGANSKSKVGRLFDQKLKEEKEISKKLERVSF